ncbi:MAG: flavin reductase family protein [Pirellulales bacterium]
MSLSPQAERQSIEQIMKMVNREVWIVTSASVERRGGLVATWVLQASLDPERPVVVTGIAPNHYTSELIEKSQAFALHLIGANQIPLAMNFAIGSGRDRDKLAGLETMTVKTGAPILRDCLAWLDCKLLNRYDTGDRVYYWADVVAGGRTLASRDNENPPLREQELFAAATAEQKQALRESALGYRVAKRSGRAPCGLISGAGI